MKTMPQIKVPTQKEQRLSGKSPQKSAGHLRYHWVLFLALVMGLFVSEGSRQPIHAQERYVDPFLQQQAAAMQTDSVAELNTLTDVPRYTLVATLDTQRGRANGVLLVEYTNRSDQALGELVFRLYANADYAYSGGSLNVTSIQQGFAIRPRRLSADRTTLRVPLVAPLQPGEKTTLRLAFTTRVPFRNRQGYGIFNREQGILSLAGWYPILAMHTQNGWLTPPVPPVGDALLAEISLYEVTLTVPAAEEVIATGSVLAQESNGYETEWQLASGPVREFAVVTGRNFSTLTETVDGTQIHVHTLPSGVQPATTPSEALHAAAAYFQVFNERFGRYPLAQLDVVESPIQGVGYEFPGLVQLQQALRVDGLPNDYRYLLAHEIAHQWWFNLVGNHVLEEAWLDEALATYAAAIAWAEADGAQAGSALIAYWGQTYGPRTPQEPTLSTPTVDFDNWNYYQRIIYYQGALFLADLRQQLGDEAFFQLLEDYGETYRYQFATTADFFEIAQEVAGRRDLTPLFTRWFDQEALSAEFP